MTAEQLNKAREIFEHYGLENQLRILQEECAELIQAVSKYLRAKEAGKPTAMQYASLMEEIADVVIMTAQISCIFTEKALNTEIMSKLDRQLGRMRSETNEQTERT